MFHSYELEEKCASKENHNIIRPVPTASRKTSLECCRQETHFCSCFMYFLLFMKIGTLNTYFFNGTHPFPVAPSSLPLAIRACLFSPTQLPAMGTGSGIDMRSPFDIHRKLLGIPKKPGLSGPGSGGSISLKTRV